MGIINMTPDSFSQDGLFLRKNDILTRAVRLAQRMIKDGAHFLDIGGESTRPGARLISTDEELHRVIPIVKKLAPKIPVPISVDTYKTRVAQEALDAGAVIINNIKGVKLEKSLLKMIQRYGAAIVLMHSRGTPRTMQRMTIYQNLMGEIISSLKNSIENCLEMGIESDKIIVDPGIGFGKTPEQNLEILNRLHELNVLRCPILVGTSRKSFIGKVLERDVEDRSWGTAATLSVSILRGAHMVRVHDVAAARDTVKMTDAILAESIP
ncbi:MAG: dihydropteroate synthase [Candidatus Omnitrophica bacterium]|nr:dihydropteroate synthase [Candidatus Omnitrophota bacterium]